MEHVYQADIFNGHLKSNLRVKTNSNLEINNHEIAHRNGEKYESYGVKLVSIKTLNMTNNISSILLINSIFILIVGKILKLIVFLRLLVIKYLATI